MQFKHHLRTESSLWLTTLPPKFAGYSDLHMERRRELLAADDDDATSRPRGKPT
jgi:hypothetical protein